MVEDIDYITEIMSFVLDSLQVVSYKWLSRKLSITANEAKRLLQIISDQHGDSLEVIYAVSGWSKKGSCYSIQLVPKPRLQEAKDMINGHVSVHVYSVQPCIPKDPAELWSAEYVQSEELFKQPPEVDNCLRDNRFSAISCASIDRKRLGTSSKVATESSTSGRDRPSSMEMMVDHSNRLELDGLAKQDVLGTSLPTLIVSESKSDNPNTMAKKAEICIPGSNKRKVVNTCIDDYGQEVTRVVWEDEDIVTGDKINVKTASINGIADTNGSVEPSKSTSKRSTHARFVSNKSSGKGSSSSSKDTSRGKISSFFKKV